MAKDTSNRIVSSDVKQTGTNVWGVPLREAVVVKDNGTVGRASGRYGTDQGAISDAIKDADHKDGIKK